MAWKKKSTILKRKYSKYGEYFIDLENEEFIDPGYYSLYDEANSYEEARIFEGNSDFLKSIADEIKIRVKITKNEIFKIGELLLTAKKLCQQKKKRFKQWIADNFDFSYETAVNFMNVFKNCLGFRDLAIKVPTSILYKISTPSFSDELKDYLFNQGNISKLTNGKFKRLVEKFNEGGIEAIEDDVEKLNRAMYVYRQVNYTFDQCKNCLIFLEELREKIENRGKERSWIGFEDRIKFYEPEAEKISSILYTCIKRCVEYLDKAMEDSQKIFEAYYNSIKDKM